jgi:AmmeMemoRadiSam system protein B
MTVIREPAVAGQFYPGDTEELGRTVRFLLEEASPRERTPRKPPKAIIVPHAGYNYSGSVAAKAYARLGPYRNRYKRVVLLGPCHRVSVTGLAVPDVEAFRTPLGDVPVDVDEVARIASLGVKISDRAHEGEHCLEVHLPFLQSVLGQFSIVPIVVGHTRPEPVANILDIAWGGPETLIVVSSDLSHYRKYDQAREFDEQTCKSIEDLSGKDIDHDHACGATPVSALLIAARNRDMKVARLDLRNSGDTCGDRHIVVGYGSWEFLE